MRINKIITSNSLNLFVTRKCKGISMENLNVDIGISKVKPHTIT